MLENFIQVGQQVMILFLLIGVGVLCGKLNLIHDHTAAELTDIILYVAAPCVIIIAFQRQYDPTMLTGLIYTSIFAACIHTANIVLAKIFIREKDAARESVMRFGVVFSNCGFMGLPLDYAILGSNGVFYGSAYIAIGNLFTWSYGILMMNKGNEQSDFSMRKIIINPGTISIAIGLVLFFCSITIPGVLYQAMDSLGALNTPLPMLVIGYRLAKSNIKEGLRDKQLYWGVFLRLILAPCLAGILLLLSHTTAEIAVVCMIAAAAPSAAMTTMFAAKYQRNVSLSVNLVSVSTLLSIISMPLLIAAIQSILG